MLLDPRQPMYYMNRLLNDPALFFVLYIPVTAAFQLVEVGGREDRREAATECVHRPRLGTDSGAVCFRRHSRGHKRRVRTRMGNLVYE